MKFGFNLLLWTTHVTDEHWPIVEKLKAAGYDGVEVPIFEGTASHYEALGRRLKDAGLASTGIGVMGSGGNAISPDAVARAKALDHLQWLIDCTVALGGDVAAWPFHQPLGQFSGKWPTADEVKWCTEVHKEAARYAAKAGLKLSVEPLNRFECYFINSMEQAAALVKAVGEPNYGYLFDTFHSNIEDNDVPALIGKTIGAINHVHVSENNRGAPGSGHINFQAVFDALKRGGYDSWLTVESFGSPLPDLAAASKIWRRLFDKDSDVYEGGIKVMREGWARAR